MNYKKTAKLLPARKAGEDFDSKAKESILILGEIFLYRKDL